jgi:hypothetical protein
LDILFSSEALRRLCHEDELALRTLGPAVVRRLHTRLDDLSAAASLAYAAKLPGRFHRLTGRNPHSRFAINLYSGFRLVIVPSVTPLPLHSDGSPDLDKITTITVISIGKLHD